MSTLTMVNLDSTPLTSTSELEDWFVERADQYGVGFGFFTFALIYLWFGATKLVPGIRTPVYYEVRIFFNELGIPALVNSLGFAYSHPTVMVSLGVFEIIVGALFAARRLKIVTPIFLFHMLMTFVALLSAPLLFFEPPFIRLGGLTIPWMVGSFSSYVLKNLFLIGAFLLLVSNAEYE